MRVRLIYQVLQLDPGVEQRLRTQLRDCILPASQKCLRLWKKGDARCPAACRHAAQHSFICMHIRAPTHQE